VDCAAGRGSGKNMKKNFTLKNTTIFFLAVFIIITILYAFNTPYLTGGINWLIHGDIKLSQENNSNKSRTLTFLGAIMAGLIAILTLNLSFKRYNQTERQIKKTEDQHKANLKATKDSNLNTSFKDAVMLLGNPDVSVRMGGGI
jgi:uncharacterized membrane protein YidH (DUF202 family)